MAAATTYPKLGETVGRTLRARAAQAPSTRFTPTLVATIMNHSSVASASQNAVLPMRKLGLIDDNGALTDRGNIWRNDATYAQACQEILEEIYPHELSGFTTPEGGPDKAVVTKWFQHQKFGDSNAKQMAAAYVMIAEKKVPEVIDKEAKPRTKRQQAPSAAAKASKPASDEAVTTAAQPRPAQPAARPAIHLDFQIHIAADARPEVIEQIFASMAKHLYPVA
jgi:hypothetical protein